MSYDVTFWRFPLSLSVGVFFFFLSKTKKLDNSKRKQRNSQQHTEQSKSTKNNKKNMTIGLEEEKKQKLRAQIVPPKLLQKGYNLFFAPSLFVMEGASIFFWGQFSTSTSLGREKNKSSPRKKSFLFCFFLSSLLARQ